MYLSKPVLDARSQHEAGEDDSDHEQQSIHHTASGGVLAAGVATGGAGAWLVEVAEVWVEGADV